ncbi:unnamed protein product [Cuscuta epithymum]|uniref:Tetraspanin/Peripherin n=1 Tax=Cuscuta epithymum TaxID=186058 RepID=A0AAV0E6N9_9ASTE|nr:unnamed protein product [Cuscuta epithymum]CAH9118376.1 unnamed protein product [Cuscuta epithymum]CAH9147604.1 unnamed protein product [Cuscuta epithymum]
MAKTRRAVKTCLSVLPILLSAPIIAAGIWASNSCANFYFQQIIISMGALMFLVGLVACCAISTEDEDASATYFGTTFLLFLMAVALFIAAFVVTGYSGSPHSVPGRNYVEYRLDHFAFWLRRRVSGYFRWNPIISCLTASNWCEKLDKTYSSSQQLFTAHLTPLQSGCCMPQAKCEYTYVSPTNWKVSKDNKTDTDCLNWSNDPRKLCYSCDSCKAGFLADIRKKIRIANLIMFITFLVAIVVCVGSCVIFTMN